jgi:hypothetical protein
MKKTAALVLMTATLVACDTSVDPHPKTRPQAQLLINGIASPLTQTVGTLYNGVVELAGVKEISGDVASDLAGLLNDIKGDPAIYRDVSASAAIRQLDTFIQLVNDNYPDEVTQCAQTDLVRAAQFLIDAINWSTANGGAVRPADQTLPWGVCPWPAPVTGLTVIDHGTNATISYYYAPNSNYFWIYQRLPDGTLSQLLGMIDANDGVEGGESAPSGGTRTFTLPITPDPNLTIIVKVCGGLHCAEAKSSVSTAAPAAPISLSGTSTTGGVELFWPEVSGAAEYRIYRDGILIETIAAGMMGFLDATAAANNLYTYAVESCNIFGCSAGQASTTVSTVGPTEVPPQPPACYVGGNNKDKTKCKTNNGQHNGQNN